MNRRPKRYIDAALYSIFFGIVGIDRFYLGYYGTGLLKLVTLGGLGVWWAIDVLILLMGKRHAKGGSDLDGYEQAKYTVWLVAAVVVFALTIGFGRIGLVCVRYC